MTSDPDMIDPRLNVGSAVLATISVLAAAVAAATAVLDRFQVTESG